jgi:hypothetical protein
VMFTCYLVRLSLVIIFCKLFVFVISLAHGLFLFQAIVVVLVKYDAY